MSTQLNLTSKPVFLVLAWVILLFATACATPVATSESIMAEAVMAAPANEVESVTEIVVEETEAVAFIPIVVTGNELSDEEIADLLFMREEEKLARDVYLTLYDVWGMNIFQNIAASEQRHTDAILLLINNYGLTDPVGNNDVGVFENPDLQALYDQLITEGSQSLSQALRVGAAIEEIDILDLYEAIDRTNHADIVQTYQSLLAGSENHLRAFVRMLERQTGEIYQPQYLSLEMYEAIINGGN